MASRPRLPCFEVRTSPIQGLGVFAVRRIRKGTRVIEYVGERISHREADARYVDDGGAEAHVLLFTVDRRTVIDGAVGGNEARFVNHSCAPNCEALIEDGRVFVEALRTIQAGEELTYDYCLKFPGGPRAGGRLRYVCRCGAGGCRGTMLAPRPARAKR